MNSVIKTFSLIAVGGIFSISGALAADSSPVVPKSPNRVPMSAQGNPSPTAILVEEDEVVIAQPPCDCPAAKEWKKHHKKKTSEEWKKWKKERAEKMLNLSDEKKKDFFAKKKAKLESLSAPEQAWALEEATFVVETLGPQTK